MFILRCVSIEESIASNLASEQRILSKSIPSFLTITFRTIRDWLLQDVSIFIQLNFEKSHLCEDDKNSILRHGTSIHSLIEVKTQNILHGIPQSARRMCLWSILHMRVLVVRISSILTEVDEDASEAVSWSIYRRTLGGSGSFYKCRTAASCCKQVKFEFCTVWNSMSFVEVRGLNCLNRRQSRFGTLSWVGA
ncbi:hypothetical protein Tco_1237200 [Tanacetum coccineum]